MRFLAGVWWRLDARRRRIAAENIRLAGISDDSREIARISLASAQHMASVVMESLNSAQLLDDTATRDDRFTVRIHPEIEAALQDPETGVIMASGHFGNWEIAAQLLSRYKPVHGITRPMNNPLVEKLIQQRKPRYDFHLVAKYSADARRFLQILAEGHVLALLTDQHAHTGGMLVDFFGRPAHTHTSAALLHLVGKAPLCFAACRRTGAMSFELETSPPIHHERTGDKQTDIRAILEQLNGHLEAVIRRDPEQYLWAHRRWR